MTSEKFIEDMAQWLMTHQPISLAINGNQELARSLFEKSGLVVYTVGTLESPALTCQARPQEGETFGEFPPRLQATTPPIRTSTSRRCPKKSCQRGMSFCS